MHIIERVYDMRSSHHIKIDHHSTKTYIARYIYICDTYIRKNARWERLTPLDHLALNQTSKITQKFLQKTYWYGYMTTMFFGRKSITPFSHQPKPRFGCFLLASSSSECHGVSHFRVNKGETSRNQLYLLFFLQTKQPLQFHFVTLTHQHHPIQSLFFIHGIKTQHSVVIWIGHRHHRHHGWSV